MMCIVGYHVLPPLRPLPVLQRRQQEAQLILQKGQQPILQRHQQEALSTPQIIVQLLLLWGSAPTLKIADAPPLNRRSIAALSLRSSLLLVVVNLKNNLTIVALLLQLRVDAPVRLGAPNSPMNIPELQTTKGIMIRASN